MKSLHAASRQFLFAVVASAGFLLVPNRANAVEPVPKWSINLKQTVGYPSQHIFIGKKYLYFMISHPRGSAHPLVVPDNRPKLNDTGETYDHDLTVTCVDGATGKKVWSRRLGGWYNLAIDPASDDLLC